jgi:hypothetical protein
VPIKVVFAPGCYGHYITACLYTFSDLNDTGKPVLQDAVSNSHYIRQEPWFGTKLYCEHPDVYAPGSCDHSMVLIPSSDHGLDYFVNNFVKTHSNSWSVWTRRHIPQQVLQAKLDQWGMGINSQSPPRWIQREFLSWHILSWISAGYDANQYRTMDHSVAIECRDLFGQLTPVLTAAAQRLGLRITAPEPVIESCHNAFRARQQYHGIQNRCKSWCDSVLSNTAADLEFDNLVAESWTQAYLRQQGFEVRCQDLDTWPSGSETMRSYIYEVR